MKKVSTAVAEHMRNFSEQTKLTIGLGFGRSVELVLRIERSEQRAVGTTTDTTPKVMKDVFGAMPRSRIALETGIAARRRKLI